MPKNKEGFATAEEDASKHLANMSLNETRQMILKAQVAYCLGNPIDTPFLDILISCHERKKDETLQKKLMKTKCPYIIKHHIELMAYMAPAFQDLLSRNLKAIDLTGLMTFCHEDQKYNAFKMVIFRIFLYAENIEAVQIFSEGDAECYKFPHITVDEPLVLDALKSLKHLRELQITIFTFNLKDVMALCRPSKTGYSNLEYINVNLKVEELPEKNELRFKLGNLKVFQCENLLDHDLEKFAEFITNPFFTNHEIVKSSLHPDLQHLSIDKRIKWQNDFGKYLDSVKHLKIDFEGWEVPKCLINEKQVWNLVSLSLQNGTYDALLKMLKSYGPNLRELHAVIDKNDTSTSTVSFPSIFNKCPKLEKIYVISQKYKKERKPISFFAKIIEMKIDSKALMKSNILEAPELKKLELLIHEESSIIGKHWFSSDKWILQNLEHMTIDMRWFRAQQVNEEHFKEIALLIKAVLHPLPRICVIKLMLNDRCNYLKLAVALRNPSIVTDQEFQKLLFMDVSVRSLFFLRDELLICILHRRHEINCLH
ncbi:Hypothetical predicted protein [Cloeon dipterum]|uniref:Uncharacterized protein n=1 Tax=Cloeon dipterum TaxID=197152 RepID=A0A8S1DV89_9INSE|nr:Hypothetical predicted protein [Cloeon dipterum]CAB3386411.1 Hypothetical predicted protein [Cloeon dipterum]